MGVQRLTPSSSSPAYRIKGSPTTGLLVLPSLAALVYVSNGGSAWTYGAWTQIESGLAYDAYLVGTIIRGSSDSNRVQIGKGGAGSETVLLQVPSIELTGAGQMPIALLPFPLLIPASTRISARSAGSNPAQQQQVGLAVVRASDLEAF